MLQSEAGYIDARPHVPQLDEILLPFATEAVEATLRRMSASPRKRPSAIEMQFVAECQ
jgi:hypothetical protein